MAVWHCLISVISISFLVAAFYCVLPRYNPKWFEGKRIGLFTRIIEKFCPSHHCKEIQMCQGLSDVIVEEAQQWCPPWSRELHRNKLSKNAFATEGNRILRTVRCLSINSISIFLHGYVGLSSGERKDCKKCRKIFPKGFQAGNKQH